MRTCERWLLKSGWALSASLALPDAPAPIQPVINKPVEDQCQGSLFLRSLTSNSILMLWHLCSLRTLIQTLYDHHRLTSC